VRTGLSGAPGLSAEPGQVQAGTSADRPEWRAGAERRAGTKSGPGWVQTGLW